jgi:transposase
MTNGLKREKLYVKNDLSCSAIAESLGMNEGSIYRWKVENATKGEAVDWDS